MPSKRLSKSLTTIVAAVICIVYLLPMVWLILTSLKVNVDVLTWPPKWIFQPTFQNYSDIFTVYDFGSSLINSIVLAFSGSLAGIVLGGMAAYGLTRYHFPFKSSISKSYLILRMLPAIALAVPIYLLVAEIRMLDTYASLIPIYIGVALPFSVWMLQGFFADVPKEIEEAAMIDGCGRMRTFVTIVVPLCAPGIAATAIFTTILIWNEFLFALVLTSNETRTLPIGVASFITDKGIMWNQLSAASVIIFTPILILTLALQKYLIRGMTMGAVKG